MLGVQAHPRLMLSIGNLHHEKRTKTREIEIDRYWTFYVKDHSKTDSYRQPRQRTTKVTKRTATVVMVSKMVLKMMRRKRRR